MTSKLALDLEHTPGDDSVRIAEGILARARAECVAAGVTPRQLAELLLAEALLALMVGCCHEHETRAIFERFVQNEIGEWYRRAGAAAERCDCAIEHMEERRLAIADFERGR